MKACSTIRLMMRGAAGSMPNARTVSSTALPMPSKIEFSFFMSARRQLRIKWFGRKIECERSPAMPALVASQPEQSAQEGNARGAGVIFQLKQRPEMELRVSGRALVGDEVEKKILPHDVRRAPVVAVDRKERGVDEAHVLVGREKRLERA